MLHKNSTSFLKMCFVAIVGLTVSCEPEPDGLGENLFTGDAAVEVGTSYPIIAYNINNNDVLRTDIIKNDSAAIGVNQNPVFGTQKVSYVSQVRLPEYPPNFGTSSTVDSVVMAFRFPYDGNKKVETIKDDYIYPEGNVPAKKVVNTYPVKFFGGNGSTNSPMTFKVEEVTEFLGGTSSEILSSKSPLLGQTVGESYFSGYVSSLDLTKKSDNTSILKYDPSFRIRLNSDYFKNKIVLGPKSEMQDAALFIRYLRGLHVSVSNASGSILKFKPENIELKMYYHRTETVNNQAVTTPQVLNFDMANSYNVMFSQVEYQRPAGWLAGQGNTNSGDAKIYLQGLGGPGMGVKVPETVISQLRQKVKDENNAIISAKLVFNSDLSSWNFPWEKPSGLLVRLSGSNAYLTDQLVLSSNPLFDFVKVSDRFKQNVASKYEITLTQSIKNAVEKNIPLQELIINVGDYKTNSNTNYLSGFSNLGTELPNAQDYNNRHFTPNQVVLIGTSSDNPKSAQLQIIYGKK